MQPSSRCGDLDRPEGFGQGTGTTPGRSAAAVAARTTPPAAEKLVALGRKANPSPLKEFGMTKMKGLAARLKPCHDTKQPEQAFFSGL
jgi:hypothetical protein